MPADGLDWLDNDAQALTTGEFVRIISCRRARSRVRGVRFTDGGTAAALRPSKPIVAEGRRVVPAPGDRADHQRWRSATDRRSPWRSCPASTSHLTIADP